MFDGIKLPRVIVEIALAVNPGADAQATPYLTLDNPATPLDTGTLGDVEIWTEITDDVESLSVRRGRSRELDNIEPGTMTIVLENHHGNYDPTNTASPYYAVDDSNIRPMLQVQARVEWDGVVYPLFRGNVTDFGFDMGNHPTCTMTVSDALFSLSGMTIDEVDPAIDSGDTTAQRVERMLDAVSWPDSLRSIDAGLTTMPATTYGDNALAVCQKAVTAENGMLFADAEGVARFYNRHHVYTDPQSVESQATFTDEISDSSDGEYLDLVVEYSVDSVANDITAQRSAEGAVAQRVTDEDSVTRYGSRDYKGQGDVKSLELTTDAEALEFAQWLLGRFKDPDLRVTNVNVDVAAQPSILTSVLGLNLLHRITVSRNYYGTPFVRDLIVQGLSIDLTRESFRYSFNTVSPDRMTPFILDESALGVGQLAY